MKNLLFIFFALFTSTVLIAQEQDANKTITVVIQTSAVCDDCKERIENLLNYTKGVTFAELDLVTKKVTVKYKPAKISLTEIKTKIAALGYEADEVKANPDGKAKLPQCCQAP